MGTVGLSFGSPTSGTGFDVSATVAAIVSNLKNVETPWNNQLTALKSQDTAISSLGTLFSNLSNDLSQLTDFEGVMAQKTGSSSDNNVLELTGASSSAVAGTHTVIVNSLATTSSGYLAPISSASDTLSGVISIQMGGGSATTINMDKLTDQSLNGLAAAINSSGAGVTASVLTDSSGSRLSLVSGTSGAGGTITIDATTNTLVDTSNSNAALSYTASSVIPADAQLTVDGVSGLTSASNTVTNLIPGVTFQLLAPSATESGGSLETIQVVIGNDNSGVESAVGSMVSDYNALISAINTQEGNDSSGNPEPLFGSPTLSLLQQQLLGGLNMQNPNGYLDAISTNTGTTLSGTISVATASGGSTEIDLADLSDMSLQGVADAINAASVGVTAAVVTQGTQSTLSLLSQTAGSAGALTVDSNIVALSDTLLSYSGSAGTSTQNSIGTLSGISADGDALSGSITIQVGSGAAQTVNVGAENDTLSDLADAINNADIGVTAIVVPNSDGTGPSTISIESNTAGTAGTLTVTSNILDATETSKATLNYNNSSDISSLANLGITISSNDDGSLSFDDTVLDSALNTDYSSVLGFFQNVDSWGQTFSTMLNNSGTSSSTGTLSLALSSDSSIESTLNANISNEESLISVQQKSLTAELNSANEILQELPSQLDSTNMLYSAITGYNENQ